MTVLGEGCQHDWRLVAVEYDDLREVRELQCDACGLTRYE